MKRAALYARVSTLEQPGGLAIQLEAMRAYAAARGLATIECVDEGVSGSQAHRAALDAMLLAAQARKIDLVICTKLDRLFRSVRHLVTVAGELAAVGVDLVVLDQAIDTSTPVGRLLFHVLAAIAEFERDLIRERVIAGVRRAQQHGTRSGRRIGRPRKAWLERAELEQLRRAGASLGAIARRFGVHTTQVRRALAAGDKPGAQAPPEFPAIRRLAAVGAAG
jgi:DNA invertase Pin-like site-specific DNA recombinase